MFFFLLFFSLSQAKCPVKKIPPQTVQLIKTTDIPNLLLQEEGCLTIVELWAGWCGTCKKIKPDLAKVLKTHPKISHISLSADYSQQALQNYLRKNKQEDTGHYLIQNWTLALLKESFIQIKAHFENAIPLILLYDPKGNLLYEATEPQDLSALQQSITQYTKENAPQ